MKRVKATFYLDARNLKALESERLRRIEAGTPRSEADLSDLVNEAIAQRFSVKAMRSKAKGAL